jgi:branched-chain amino acid aminotransferase
MALSIYRLDGTRTFSLRIKGTTPDEISRRLPHGLYTTFKTNNNGTRVLGLSRHLDRLYDPAKAEGVRPSASQTDLRQALSVLAQKYVPGESRFRVILITADGVVVIIHQPFPPISANIYKKGVKAITSDLVRNDPRRKDLKFIGESQSERSRVGKDVYEVLLTKNRRIYEGMTSNFYIVKYGARGEATPDALTSRDQGATLVTARDGILLGVTRRAILRLARGQGMSINYRLPSLCESFKEAFISSSSRGVVPVVSIDGDQVGEGRVGIWTQRLIRAYALYEETHSELIVSS